MARLAGPGRIRRTRAQSDFSRLALRMVTRERLLEWETAAEAELGTRSNPVDRYLNWMPVLAAAVGFLVWAVRPRSLAAAILILLLWACSKLVAMWLNGSPNAAG